LTPHQWRHTFACRLINRDVPQEVIRILLDHQSTQMTAHYANPRELHQMGGLSRLAC
jgi:integrase